MNMQFTNEMVYSSFEGQLINYSIYNNKLVYLTDGQFAVIDIGIKPKKQSFNLKGHTVVKFQVGSNGNVAIVYVNFVLQIRKIGKINQVICFFSQIMYDINRNLPLLKWVKDQVYTVYGDKIQIFDIVNKKSGGFDDILYSQQNQRIIDIITSQLMQAQQIVTLRLMHKIVFTIIPLQVTQMIIQNLNHIMNLVHPKSFPKIKRQYMILVTDNRFLKVYNFITLKQIAEVDFKTKAKQTIQIQKDPYNQFLLITIIQETKQYGVPKRRLQKNYLMCINKEQFYMKKQQQQKQGANFFLYTVQLELKEKLSLLTSHRQIIQKQFYNSVDMCYIKKNEIVLVSRLIRDNPKSNIKELVQYRKNWTQVRQWKEIITSYMQMSTDYILDFNRRLGLVDSLQKNLESLYKKEKQQYQHIKQNFDKIVQHFYKYIQNTKSGTLQTQEEEQQFMYDEWSKFFPKYLKQNKYVLTPLSFAKFEVEGGTNSLTRVKSRQSLKRQNQRQRQEKIKQYQDVQRKRQQKRKLMQRQKNKMVQQMQKQKQKLRIRQQQQRKKQQQLKKEQYMKDYQIQYQKFVTQFFQQIQNRQNLQIQQKQYEEISIQARTTFSKITQTLSKIAQESTNNLIDSKKVQNLSQPKNKINLIEVQNIQKSSKKKKTKKKRQKLKQQQKPIIYKQFQQKQKELSQNTQQQSLKKQNSIQKQRQKCKSILQPNFKQQKHDYQQKKMKSFSFSQQGTHELKDKKKKLNKKKKQYVQKYKQQQSKKLTQNTSAKTLEKQKQKFYQQIVQTQQLDISQARMEVNKSLQQLEKMNQSKQLKQRQQIQRQEEQKRLQKIRQKQEANKKQLLDYIIQQTDIIFQPISEKMKTICQSICRIEQNHTFKLRQIQQVFQNQSQINISKKIQSYCQQMLTQVTNKFYDGINSFNSKIMSLQQKSTKNRQKILQKYKKFVNHQIKNRIQVFDKNRQNVQNCLTFLKDEIQVQQENLKNQELFNLFKDKYWFNQEEIKRLQKKFYNQSQLKLPQNQQQW